jgi:hypothetical protein
MTCLIDGPARWDIGAADNPSLSVDCPDHPYSVCHGYHSRSPDNAFR